MNSLSLDLPIIYQTLNVDIEPVAKLRDFSPDAYDVANWTGVIAVSSPADQEYELVLPFAIESGTPATIAVVSGDDETFSNVATFKRPPKGIDFLAYLKKMGLLPDSATELTPELQELVKGFKVAKLRIPQGQHVLRIHASQKLLSHSDDMRAYQLILYAPLCNFTVGGGQTNLTAIVTFPPDFQAATAVEQPIVEGLPGQNTPGEGSPAASPVQAANQKVFAWHWRNDPKVTINYRYS